ncbi:hypothetical protein CAEBREN_17983 [Caenorhabditis brenneri]|uniref:Uncharacterized protein n=1 Tax=Caenorhabditis brenneri TaxID=135651 RepID=G0MX28_CAEBE|nr:hypothetical protein CAEBREN_17983 [Caenorhabditis brenneri]
MQPDSVVKEEVFSEDEQIETNTPNENVHREIKPEPMTHGFSQDSQMSFSGNTSEFSKKSNFVGNNMPFRSDNNGRSMFSCNRQIKPEPLEHGLMQDSGIGVPGKTSNTSEKSKFVGHDMPLRYDNNQRTIRLSSRPMKLQQPEDEFMQDHQVTVSANTSNAKKFVGHDIPICSDNYETTMNSCRQPPGVSPDSRIMCSGNTSTVNEHFGDDILVMMPSRSDNNARTMDLCNRQNNQKPPKQNFLQHPGKMVSDTNQSKQWVSEETAKRNNEVNKGNSRPLLVTYDSDDEFEKEFGVSSLPPKQKNQRVKEWPSYMSTKTDPHQIILDLDFEEIGVMLRAMLIQDPQKCIEAVFAKNSLHEILTVTYLESLRSCRPVAKSRYEAMEKVFRVSLTYLPTTVLWRQDEGGNTLLHRAIHARAENIVKYLINMGSPLYVRNCQNMTVVETCIVMRAYHLLDIVIKNGGTFHHLLDTNPLLGSDHYELHKNEAAAFPWVLPVAEKYHLMLKEACGAVRNAFTGHRLREIDHGPIISFQRGVLPSTHFQHTIEFTAPENWVGFTSFRFMLVIIQVVFKKGRFVARSRTPCVLEPIVCGQHCPRMVKKNAGTIFYQATKAMRNHFKTCKEQNMLAVNEGLTQSNPRLCTITLDIAPRAQFSFLACQLVAFKPLVNPLPLPPIIQTKKRKFNKKRNNKRGTKRQHSNSNAPYIGHKNMKWSSGHH